MTIQLPIDPDKLARFCTQNQIRRLSLFGSMLTGSERPDSDIDLLVEFEPGRELGLLGMGQLEAELGSLLGLRVDLRTAQDLSRYFRDEVLRTAEVSMRTEDQIRVQHRLEQFIRNSSEGLPC